jgi:hypothetical protein
MTLFLIHSFIIFTLYNEYNGYQNICHKPNQDNMSETNIEKALPGKAGL